MTDPRAVQAAANNGDWYAMMFDVHGLRYRRDELLFWAEDPPPAYHSAAVVQAPDRSADVAERIPDRETQARFGIKDSFAQLPLDQLDLAELFAAFWLWGQDLPPVDTAGWERITTPDHLMAWEAAWRDSGSPTEVRQFPDPTLDRPDVAIFGRRSRPDAGANNEPGTGSDAGFQIGFDVGFDAGVIANRSGDCVGLSNAFGPAEAYPAAAALCQQFGDGLPVVGYEWGDDLATALAAGFVTVGELRVLYRPQAAQMEQAES